MNIIKGKANAALFTRGCKIQFSLFSKWYKLKSCHFYLFILIEFVLDMKEFDFAFGDFNWKKRANRKVPLHLYARTVAQSVAPQEHRGEMYEELREDSELGDSLPFRAASFCDPTGHEYQAERAGRAACTQSGQAAALSCWKPSW